MEGAKAKLTDVNPHLVCVLCHGYFVDATTIAECLHSFCRSCIFRHLERKPICPICEVAVHNTKFHRSLRPDKTLQDIVYKLVPGLYRNEMQRRRDFYKQHPFRDEYLEPECRGVGLDRVIYSPDDLISLSLEFYDEDREREEWNNNNVIQKPVPVKKPLPGSKRYLQCPANFKMKHLKKFIRQKCGLLDNCEVEVIYRKESLPDSYSLMDVAYIYTWKRNEPMRFYYKLPDVHMKTLDAAKALASFKIVKVVSETEENKDDVKVPNEETKSIEILPNSDAKSEIVEAMKKDPAPLPNGKQETEKVEFNSTIEPVAVHVQDVAKEDPVASRTLPPEKTPVATPPLVIPDEQKSAVLENGPLAKEKEERVDPIVPRAMTKQDELPVSVLLALGNSAPDLKRLSPHAENRSPRSEPKFILPKPLEHKTSLTPEQSLKKKLSNGKNTSKNSVNKIASDLAENKIQSKKFKTPSPLSRDPLALGAPQSMQFKLADQSTGNRTPFHHSQTPQHLPVYPSPLMPSMNKILPWKNASKDLGRHSMFSQSPRHVPQYPSLLTRTPTQTVAKKEFSTNSQDPFVFQPSENDSLKVDKTSNGDVNHSKPSSPVVITDIKSNHEGTVPQIVRNGVLNHKADRPEVTVKTSNGSLTISTQLPKPVINNESKKPEQPQVLQKNISGQRLTNLTKKKPVSENKLKLTDDLSQEPKNTSLSRKNHPIVPGGVVSRTGPTLDQRLQQLYKSNARQVNGQSLSQKSQPLQPESRLASWLNNRFNSQTKPSSPPSADKPVKTKESATEKLGKEMTMLKRKLDELRKNSEGCEITQENPNPEAVQKMRNVTPNVSIEFLKGADMKRIESATSVKTAAKEKNLKRPVPGLKAIQEVDVKKIKMCSPEETEESEIKKGDEALDLSGAGKPSDELAHRIALLQKNGALNNQQQFNWLLSRPLIAGQQFGPRST